MPTFDTPTAAIGEGARRIAIHPASAAADGWAEAAPAAGDQYRSRRPTSARRPGIGARARTVPMVLAL